MTLSSRNKIVKEFGIANDQIIYAYARQDLASMKTVKSLIKNQWSNLFFQSSVMNQTDYFLKFEYSTKANEASDPTENKLKHTKLIGFIESRIKILLQFL